MTVAYQQCALAATCACAVEVHVRGTSVLFDRCRRVGATGAPAAMTVTMPLAGSPVFLSVYQHSDLLTYYVSINKKGFCFLQRVYLSANGGMSLRSIYLSAAVSLLATSRLSVVNDALLSSCQ